MKWLESFEQHCLKTEKQNTVAIHLRNIRAAFNAAIDEERTTNYPFRKFKIKRELSVDKSFSARELRTLFEHKCYPGGEEKAIIEYYNKRGASERNFDCQNNDFGWAHLPFSFLKENNEN